MSLSSSLGQLSAASFPTHGQVIRQTRVNAPSCSLPFLNLRFCLVPVLYKAAQRPGEQDRKARFAPPCHSSMLHLPVPACSWEPQKGLFSGPRLLSARWLFSSLLHRSDSFTLLVQRVPAGLGGVFSQAVSYPAHGLLPLLRE